MHCPRNGGKSEGKILTGCPPLVSRPAGEARERQLDMGDTTSARPFLLWVYLGATWLLSPLLHLLVLWRRARGKEDPQRYPERLGRATQPRPQGQLVWFHAASVGESLSLLPLIERLLRERPALSALVTTGTVTAARMMALRLPERAFHQFVPIDTPGAVAGFLNHWQPDLGIWVESELWPRLVTRSAARGIPLLLINARISARSARRWQKVPATAQAILSCFGHILTQDEDTAVRLRALGQHRVTVAGTTKESAGPAPVDADKLAGLRALIGDRPVWLAASIHAGEEEAVAEAQALVLDRHPTALLLYALRHPDKEAQMRTAFEAKGMTCATRSRAEPITAQTQVYLADTLGEMGLWFSLAPICFVGGSFVPVGGHNPFEPLLFGAHVLHGPLVANFAAYYADFDARGITREVAGGAALGLAVAALIGQPRPAAMQPPQAPLDAALARILPSLDRA